MTAVETFKNDIQNWLHKNGFNDLMLGFAKDFAYALFENNKTGIVIGVKGYPEIGRYFEQFLYEYGLEYSGILDPVLCFCHELGHHITFKFFTKEEKALFELSKQFDHGESDQEWLNKYWEIPDEFAANIWAINFINNHIEAVEELCSIYIKDWPAIFEETTIEELVKEAA